MDKELGWWKGSHVPQPVAATPEQTHVRMWIERHDKLLISSVAQNPWLYDATHESYKDNIAKRESWASIATHLDIDVEECKKRWTNLRDRYVRMRRINAKALHIGSGADAISTLKWNLFPSIDALLHNTTQRRKVNRMFERKLDALLESSGHGSQSYAESASQAWSENSPTTSSDRLDMEKHIILDESGLAQVALPVEAGEGSAMPGVEASAMPGVEASAMPGVEAKVMPGVGARAMPGVEASGKTHARKKKASRKGNEESPSWQQRFVAAFEKNVAAREQRNNPADIIGECIATQLRTVKDPERQSGIACELFAALHKAMYNQGGGDSEQGRKRPRGRLFNAMNVIHPGALDAEKSSPGARTSWPSSQPTPTTSDSDSNDASTRPHRDTTPAEEAPAYSGVKIKSEPLEDDETEDHNERDRKKMRLSEDFSGRWEKVPNAAGEDFEEELECETDPFAFTLDGRPIKQEMEWIDEDVDGVDKKVDGVDKEVDGVDKEVDGMDKDVDGVDEEVDGVDKEVDGVDEEVNGVDKEVDGVDEDMDEEVEEPASPPEPSPPPPPPPLAEEKKQEMFKLKLPGGKSIPVTFITDPKQVQTKMKMGTITPAPKEARDKCSPAALPSLPTTPSPALPTPLPALPTPLPALPSLATHLTCFPIKIKTVTGNQLRASSRTPGLLPSHLSRPLPSLLVKKSYHSDQAIVLKISTQDTEQVDVAAPADNVTPPQVDVAAPADSVTQTQVDVAAPAYSVTQPQVDVPEPTDNVTPPQVDVPAPADSVTPAHEGAVEDEEALYGRHVAAAIRKLSTLPKFGLKFRIQRLLSEFEKAHGKSSK